MTPQLIDSGDREGRDANGVENGGEKKVDEEDGNTEEQMRRRAIPNSLEAKKQQCKNQIARETQGDGKRGKRNDDEQEEKGKEQEENEKEDRRTRSVR